MFVERKNVFLNLSQFSGRRYACFCYRPTVCINTAVVQHPDVKYKKCVLRCGDVIFHHKTILQYLCGVSVLVTRILIRSCVPLRASFPFFLNQIYAFSIKGKLDVVIIRRTNLPFRSIREHSKTTQTRFK